MNIAIEKSTYRDLRTDEAAFTLIELLIAVAISATVLVVVNTLFFSVLHLRSTVTETAEQTLPVDNAVATMKRDILNIVPPGVLAGSMGTDAQGTGTVGTPLLEIFTADGVITSDKPWGEVQKIDYSLQAPTNASRTSGRSLVRGVTRNLLSTATVNPDQQTLLSDVQNMAFSFYDGTNWNDTWSTTLSNIPVAIKVTVDFTANRTDTHVKPSVQFMVPVVVWDSTNSVTNQLSSN